jgi:hypothetical protein
MQFKEVQIPEGDLIGYENGELVIGDHPVIGVLQRGRHRSGHHARDAAGHGFGGPEAPTAVGGRSPGRRCMPAWRACIITGASSRRRRWRPSATSAGRHQGAVHDAHRRGDPRLPGDCASSTTREDVRQVPRMPARDITERFRSINVRFRQHLDLFACVRPVRYFEGVPSPNKYADKVELHHLPREYGGRLRRSSTSRKAARRRWRSST